MQRNPSRALRRHHRARVIARRTRLGHPYWGRGPWSLDPWFTPAHVGQLARTPKICNCWMCRNPRRVFRDLLLREKSDLEAIERGVV